MWKNHEQHPPVASLSELHGLNHAGNHELELYVWIGLHLNKTDSLNWGMAAILFNKFSIFLIIIEVYTHLSILTSILWRLVKNRRTGLKKNCSNCETIAWVGLNVPKVRSPPQKKKVYLTVHLFFKRDMLDFVCANMNRVFCCCCLREPKKSVAKDAF